MKNKEQRESLLLMNLTKLLPYSLICHVENDEDLYVLHGLVCEDMEWYAELWPYGISNKVIERANIKKIKPYLQPIDKLSEYEKDMFVQLQNNVIYNNSKTGIEFACDWLEWCYYHQIDIHNLILQGLALDGTELSENIFRYLDNPNMDLINIYLNNKSR